MLAGHQADGPHRLQTLDGEDVDGLLILAAVDRLIEVALLADEHLALDEEDIIELALLGGEVEADLLQIGRASCRERV